MREFFTYSMFVGLLSLAAGGCAIFLAFVDKKAAAGTMAGIFIAMALVSQIDKLKSFEAFTIKAQLQDRIDRADELLKQLRELSLMVAKGGYASTGLATMTFGGVQASTYDLTKDFDGLISKLKLTDEERRSIRQPLVRALAFRIFSGFQLVVMNIQHHQPWDTAEESKLIVADYNELVNRHQTRLPNVDTAKDMRELLTLFIPGNMNAKQQQAVNRFLERTVSLYEGCLRAGGPTPEFIEFERRSFPGGILSTGGKALYEGRDPD